MASEGYVNEGLQRWEKLRSDWKSGSLSAAAAAAAGGGKPAAGGPPRRGEVRAKSIDVEEVIERIFSQTGKGILPEPIPLGQMIDILVDFWESGPSSAARHAQILLFPFVSLFVDVHEGKADTKL